MRIPVSTAWAACLALVAFFALCVNHARAGEPDPNLKPAYGSVTLKVGFLPDPFTKNLTAGGPIRTKLGGLTANVSKRPDFRLNYTAGGSPLKIYVESTGDTTLHVRLPDGTLIADDDTGKGKNPLVHFLKPQSGRYDIWVGTYGQKTVAATLKISERTSSTVTPGKPLTARRIVCTPVDWVQVNLDAGLSWFGRDVPGIREAPETKDSLTAMLKKHGFETQYRGVKGTGGSVKLQLFARLTKESRTPCTGVTERRDREVNAIADMVYGGTKVVGKKVYVSK